MAEAEALEVQARHDGFVRVLGNLKCCDIGEANADLRRANEADNLTALTIVTEGVLHGPLLRRSKGTTYTGKYRARAEGRNPKTPEGCVT